ncbi:MAG: pantetheine-phosphate adenylyltransferase [Verrucomicrobia bacterium]|nr:pantetheine-phosphate adenylyltransferase [Verrucomicrobiota bacterium]
MKTGLFPGSFDPPSFGHLDIIQRAAGLCDQLLVALADHPTKHPLFSLHERLDMLHQLTRKFPNVEVGQFHGLAVDFARERNVSFLIRGLRSYADFEYEYQMAVANRRLSGIETLFLMSGEEHARISSSLIREIGAYGGSLLQFVPHEIERVVRKKFESL